MLHVVGGGLFQCELSGVEADIVIPSLTNTDEIGESSQPFALPSRQISPFLSGSVQGPEPQGRWHPVSAFAIAQLANQYDIRVFT